SILLYISGCFCTFLPIQKKVALALYSDNLFNTQSVISGVGPSSKVKYRFLPGDFMSHTYDGKSNLTNLGVLGINIIIKQLTRSYYSTTESGTFSSISMPSIETETES